MVTVSGTIQTWAESLGKNENNRWLTVSWSALRRTLSTGKPGWVTQFCISSLTGMPDASARASQRWWLAAQSKA